MKTQEQHVESRGLLCPHCNGSDIEGGFVEIVDGSAYQECSCHGCDYTWSDQYKLVGYEPGEGEEP